MQLILIVCHRDISINLHMPHRKKWKILNHRCNSEAHFTSLKLSQLTLLHFDMAKLTHNNDLSLLLLIFHFPAIFLILTFTKNRFYL